MGAREAALIIELVPRLRHEGNLAIVMIMYNHAQMLDVADRIVLIQHGRITYEKDTAAPSVAELMDGANIVRCERVRAGRWRLPLRVAAG